MSSKKNPPEPAVPSDARSRILAAARARVQHVSLEELTLAGVARSAGVSRQTVYSHFADRNDLAASVFIEFAEAHIEPARRQAMGERLDAAVLEAVFWADVEAAREFFGESAGQTSEVRSRIEDFILESPRMREYQQRAWVPVLERFADAGLLRAGVDPVDFAHWLTYQQTWLVTHPTALGDADAARHHIRVNVIEVLVPKRS